MRNPPSELLNPFVVSPATLPVELTVLPTTLVVPSTTLPTVEAVLFTTPPTVLLTPPTKPPPPAPPEADVRCTLLFELAELMDRASASALLVRARPRAWVMEVIVAEIGTASE